MVLPRIGHLEAWVGVPLRLATSSVVADVLAAVGWAVVDLGAVLEVGGRTTAIDLPCSGVRSLWTGVAFVAATAWLERRRFGVRLLVVVLGVGALLVGFNGVRVLVLVLLDRSGLPGAQVAATILHEPLGGLAFLMACGAGWAGLRWTPEHPPHPELLSRAPLQTRVWAGLAVLCVLALAVPRGSPSPVNATLALPPGWHRVNPPAAERARVAEQHGRLAMAQTAGDAPLAAELVLVWGTSVRAQHRPDICLRASGATVDVVVPAIVAGVPVSTAVVETQHGPARVIWWFQSERGTTGSHGRRLWDGLLSGAPQLLVSVLVQDGPVAPPLDSPEVVAMVRDLSAHGEAFLAPPALASNHVEMP